MNIFQKVYQSIYSPSFYKKARTSKLSSAVGYFFLLCLILSVAYTLFLLVPMTIGIKSFLYSAPNYYPAHLTLTIHNGIVKTNEKEPYFVALPGETEGYKNLVVIDTKNDFSQTRFNRYDSYVWVTRDSIFLRSTTEQTRSVDLSKIKDFTLNRNIVSMIANKVISYLPLIVFAIGVILLIFWYFVILLNFIPLFLAAFIIWLIAKKMVKKLTYKQAYTISLYAATGGLLLNTLLEILAPRIQIPFTMTILTVVLFLVNLRDEFKQKKAK